MFRFIKLNWLFLGILIIQLFVLIFSFAFYKQGYHSDELYEYGFANSYDLRVVEQTDDGIGLDRQWIDSKELLDYISVDKDHRFSYKNIFKHASMDYYNPPLKLFVLHTICSFFPGVFSRWFSFSINIASFIILQVFLFLLLKKMTNSYAASISGICLFGFGAGCFNAMTFLRMYAMGMAIGVVFLYFSYLYIYEKIKRKNAINIIFIFISLFCGAYTLHLFLVFAFPIVLVICIGYLFTKRIKKMLCYGFTCLGAVGLSFLAFPKTFGDTIQSTDNYSYSASKYSDIMQFRIFTSMATQDNFGLHTDMYSNIWMKNIVAVILFIVILSIPLFFLFRKEEWFKRFISRYKDRSLLHIRTIGFNFVFLIACLSSIIFVFYIASMRTSIYTMALKFSSRYVYMVYPLLCIFSVVSFYYLIHFLTDNKRFIAAVMVSSSLLLASYSQLLNTQPYLMIHEERGITLDKIQSDANCYILMLSKWFMLCFADELYDTNSYYFAEYKNYKEEIDCFKEVDRNKPLYFILDCSYIITDEVKKEMQEDSDSFYNTIYKDVMIDEDDILNHYRLLEDVENIELVGEDNVFGRRIKIFKVNLN